MFIKETKKYINRQTITVISLLFCLISLLILNLSLFIYAPSQPVEAKENKTNSQIVFWQNFLELHPTYFEGWIELSKLEYLNGDKQMAIYSYNKAFSINPNSSEVSILKSRLGL